MDTTDVYDELLRWAEGRGVELHGIAPRSIPNRGIGIVVTKPIKVQFTLQIRRCLSGYPPNHSGLTFHPGEREDSPCAHVRPPHH